MPPADGWWPPPSTPIAVEGGLQARSQRGRIGDTWWSQRFITVLETIGIGSRLQRGKRYARTGQVLAMEVTAGQVKASVQGSRSKPYRVFIETDVLTASEWEAVESVMASSAVFAARLLADEMPEEIEEAFADSSVSLFPTIGRRTRLGLLVPGLGEPVQAHRRGLLPPGGVVRRRPVPHLRLAWTDEGGSAHRPAGPPAWTGIEPMTAWIGCHGGAGRHRAVRVAGRRSRPHRCKQAADSMSLWGVEADVAAIETRPRLAVASDLVLRQLDPAPLGADGDRIIEELRVLYEAITSGAAALALGDESEQTTVVRQSSG